MKNTKQIFTLSLVIVILIAFGFCLTVNNVLVVNAATPKVKSRAVKASAANKAAAAAKKAQKDKLLAMLSLQKKAKDKQQAELNKALAKKKKTVIKGVCKVQVTKKKDGTKKSVKVCTKK